MKSYITVKQHGTSEYEDRKSVFIGECAPASTEAEAIAFIDSIKRKYPDARHHVYAYVLRENFTMRFTDDREPQGTAGMPVLDIIRKNEVTDTVIVVVRYFGGTLLGTGGLVRAYTAAALGALQKAEIIKYDIYNEISVSVGYSDYGKITSFFEEYEVRTIDTVYTDSVELILKLPKSRYTSFEKALIDITSNRVNVRVLSEKYDY